MDSETEIAERLKQNIPREETPNPEAPSVGTSNTEKDLGYVDGTPFDEITRYRLCEQFNIVSYMQSDPIILGKLSLVYGWAAVVGDSEDFTDIKNLINSTELGMGYSATQNRLDRLYQFAKLDLQRRKIEKDMMYA